MEYWENAALQHSITPLLRSAVPVRVEADPELDSHFKVTYDTGEVAEVSWSFIRELQPRK